MSPVTTLQVPLPRGQGLGLHYLPEGLLWSAPSLGAVSPLITPNPSKGEGEGLSVILKVVLLF